MKPWFQATIPIWGAVAAAALLASCGGEDSNSRPPPPPPPPTSYDHETDTFQNTAISDRLDATEVDHATATYSISTPAQFGVITLDPATGDFTYDPDTGYLGADDFFWDVSDQWGVSRTAEYVIDVGGIYAQVERTSVDALVASK